jgi:hypothetical protein
VARAGGSLARTDHEVVQKWDAYKVATLGNVCSHLPIVGTGGGVTTRMVVSEDDGGSVCSHRRRNHIAGSQRATMKASLRKLARAHDLGASVDEQRPHFFVRKVAEDVVKQLRRRLLTIERRACGIGYGQNSVRNEADFIERNIFGHGFPYLR